MTLKPKCSFIKNSCPPKSFQQICILEPSPMDESLIIHKYAQFFLCWGEGGEVDIINILYVNFSFFLAGGWCHDLARNYPSGKTRKNQENMFSFLRIKVSFHGNVSGSIPYVSLQSLAFQSAFLAMSKTWMIAIFEDPFFCPKKSCNNPGKGHRNQRKFHILMNQNMRESTKWFGANIHVKTWGSCISWPFEQIQLVEVNLEFCLQLHLWHFKSGTENYPK